MKIIQLSYSQLKRLFRSGKYKPFTSEFHGHQEIYRIQDGKKYFVEIENTRERKITDKVQKILRDMDDKICTRYSCKKSCLNTLPKVIHYALRRIFLYEESECENS